MKTIPARSSVSDDLLRTTVVHQAQAIHALEQSLGGAIVRAHTLDLKIAYLEMLLVNFFTVFRAEGQNIHALTAAIEPLASVANDVTTRQERRMKGTL